jgi:acyl-CoA:acyl-CoA alkyltransferase
MLYQNVYIEGFGIEIPSNVVTTEAIDSQLAPVYSKLNMKPGSLEMMTGLKERHFWDDGTRPSEAATKAAVKALNDAAMVPSDIGALLNCSVCRDYLEPATATVIARRLEIPQNTILFDVSNACLGFATGLSVAANMIELGQAKSVLVVSSEAASEVVENTIKAILANPSEQLFLASIPSLTLGSAAVAFLLVDRSIQKRGIRFLGGTTNNDSQQSELCLWGPDTGFPSTLNHTMMTDGKVLLEKGVRLARKTWDKFQEEIPLSTSDIDRTFCHQVGILHRNVVFDEIGLDVAKDFTTYEYLGNTGSAAMPVTIAIGIEKKAFLPGQTAVMMGIGSGLVCTIYGLKWEA